MIFLLCNLLEYFNFPNVYFSSEERQVMFIMSNNCPAYKPKGHRQCYL